MSALSFATKPRHGILSPEYPRTLFQLYSSMLTETNGKRRDFTRVLTHDEISGIFMYLAQHDCVQCMQVSQRWRRWVPLYAETTFSHVELDGTRDYRRYHCFITCLGPHTKSLVVKGCSDANALSHLMDLLKERGCQEGTESLEFHKCYVPGDLASRLCQWNHLKYLTLSQMTHIMDTEAFYLSLITRCRSLTALYIECDFMMMCEPTAESVPIAMTTTTTTNFNMRHLSWKVFGGELEQPRDFQSLLLQCPNLISLEGWLATDFDTKVFEWCPNLQHLRWVGRHPNRHYYQLPRNDQELQALDDQHDVDYHHQLKGLSMQHYHLLTFMNQHRLRYLELDVEQEQQNDAIQLLERNASTLQSLLLEIDGILLPIMACLYEFGIIQRLVSLVLLVRPFNSYEGPRPPNAALPDLLQLLYKMVSQSASLQWIALDFLDVFGEFGLQEQKCMLSTIGHIPHLKSIELEEDTLHPDVLLALFRHALELQHVVVRCNHLMVTYKVLDALKHLSNLKTLHFHAAGSISAQGVRHLAKKKGMAWTVELLESDEDDHACFNDAKEMMKDRFSYYSRN